MKTFKDYLIEETTVEMLDLNEGVFDKANFKVFFLAGGSGSGKSYVTKGTTGGFGLKMINSDQDFERRMADADISLDLQSLDKETFGKAMDLRSKAKETVSKKFEQFAKNKSGMIIDGTAKDYDKISKKADRLKALGYDVYMIFVNTNLEVALARNMLRKRKVPVNVATQSWHDVQGNIGKFQNYFGAENFILVDNNDAGEDIMKKVWKTTKKLVERPVKNHIAKSWIKAEMDARNRLKEALETEELDESAEESEFFYQEYNNIFYKKMEDGKVMSVNFTDTTGKAKKAKWEGKNILKRIHPPAIELEASDIPSDVLAKFTAKLK